jgi:hypothetical protein
VHDARYTLVVHGSEDVRMGREVSVATEPVAGVGTLVFPASGRLMRWTPQQGLAQIGEFASGAERMKAPFPSSRRRPSEAVAPPWNSPCSDPTESFASASNVHRATGTGPGGGAAAPCFRAASTA